MTIPLSNHNWQFPKRRRECTGRVQTRKYPVSLKVWPNTEVTNTYWTLSNFFFQLKPNNVSETVSTSYSAESIGMNCRSRI